MRSLVGGRLFKIDHLDRVTEIQTHRRHKKEPQARARGPRAYGLGGRGVGGDGVPPSPA